MVFDARSIFEKDWSVSQSVTRFSTFFDMTSTDFDITSKDFDIFRHNFDCPEMSRMSKCRGHFLGGGPDNALMR